MSAETSTARAWLHAIAAGRVEFHDGAFLYENLLVSSYDQQILRELVLSGLAAKRGSLIKLTADGETELAR